VITLKAGLGKRQRLAMAERLASVPPGEGRVILATGRYIGEGFDDARLDTLFLTLPVSWRGTVAQYAGRLHRTHDGKRDVRVYDEVGWTTSVRCSTTRECRQRCATNAGRQREQNGLRSLARHHRSDVELHRFGCPP